MRGCNDCALDDDGNLWFTAPAGSSLERPDGEVHCRRANGEIVQIANCFAFPNGVAVSPDGRTLVIAETFTYDLWAWDIIGPGDVTNLRRFGLVPGDQATGGDGMDYDSDGRLIVADWGGNTLDAFDPDGRCVLRMRLPFDAPSNLHFGGDDGRDLLVTEHGTNGLWRGRWPVPGIRLHVACTARSS
jgi:gluconolactonase